MSKLVRNKLFEDPDTTYAKDGTPLRWDSGPVHPFGVNVNMGKLMVGPNAQSHYGMNSESAFAFPDYEGRIWPDAGVMAFWEAPPKNMLINILKLLLQDKRLSKYNLTMDDFDDFLFDIPNPDQTFDEEDAIYTLDEYPENPKITVKDQKFDVKIKRPQHTVSPLKKKKEEQPKVTGGGSYKYAKEKPLAWRQAMQTSESVINENPNAIIDPTDWEKNKNKPSHTPSKIEYDAPGAIPFGFFGSDNVLVIGNRRQTHMHLLKKAGEEGLIRTASEAKERGKNSGRLFPVQKVITFWNFPRDYKELEKVIKDLETLTGLKILNDPEWRIEIPAGEFKGALDSDQGSWGSWHPRIGQVAYIPIDEYKGGYTRSEDELGQEHVKSPLLKKKKSIGNWGSGKPRGLERLKMRYAMGESFYPRLK
jgi:hypothetical protein